MQKQTDVNPNKKAGKRYTRKELLALGWTDELIGQRLKAQESKGKRFYRAAEVTAAMQDAELAVELENNRKRTTARNDTRDMPQTLRRELAVKVADTLTEAIQKVNLTDDEKAVAEVWHNLFIAAMKDQQKSVTYSILLRDELLEKLSNCAGRKKPVTELAKAWSHCGRSAWQLWSAELNCAPSSVYVAALTLLARREVEEFRAHDITAPLPEVLAVPVVQSAYPAKQDLYSCYMTYYVPESISRDLTRLLAVDPKDEYPEARQMRREVQIHVGGTNTGKTYQSLQRLKEAETGVYLAPLRLLALEVQERLLDNGVICSMLTGEEEDIREGATHVSSTVEKLDVSKEYDVAVIDECQMICDKQRGYAWTRAILGVRAKEIHLCVAPEGLGILKRLLKDLKEDYVVVEHKRKTPLTWEARTVYPKDVQKGDAFVAFSKRRVLQMAEMLRKDGTPASIIYGNLPYATRRQQMQMFLDGETTALVATDAIGMGLNLPIRRVIFMEDKKYDGEEVRPLHAGEVRQIAGRAGRFGIYDEGFAAAGPECSHVDLPSLLNTIPENVHYAALGFSDLVLKVDHPLIDVLKIWNQLPVKGPYQRMDISRHIFIINYIQSVLHMEFSKEDQLRAGNIPFDERDQDLLDLFGSYCKYYMAGAQSVEVPVRDGQRLADLELYYKKLDLYYSFSKNFGMTWDKDWLTEEKQLVAEEINYLLVNDLKTRGVSCRECGGPLPLFSKYGLCDKCFREGTAARRATMEETKSKKKTC